MAQSFPKNPESGKSPVQLVFKKDSVVENYELKNGTETLLDEALYLLTAQPSPPTLWQLFCFLESLNDCRRGFYRRAWNYALDIMADNVSDKLADQPTKEKELSGITLETLRAGLMAIKELPVFDQINFGPIEIIPDWARKQQGRYGLIEPLSIG